MKNNFAFACALGCGFSLFAATPSISSVTLSYDGGRTPAVITYKLSGEPAIVTVDIETNTLEDASGDWVQVGGESTGQFIGAASTVVCELDKTVKAYWLPAQAWSGVKIPAGALRARLTAYPTNSPPDYMVVNLSGFTNTVRFYSCEAALPGGIDSDLYRTNAMVMRRIPASNVVWRMGIPEGEANSGGYNQTHKVLLTEDYYMGVFELTQGQYSLFGKNPSEIKNIEDNHKYPVETIAHDKLRGQSATADDPYIWPSENHALSPTSIIGLMRKQTGLKTLDLPTDAQWEYACRAGKGTPINTGLKSPNNARWNEVAWSSENTKSYQPVGSKQANFWGLYDMHGNILEICLDWASDDESKYHATFQDGWQDGAVTTNPVGVAFSAVSTESALRVVKRGGSYRHNPSHLPSGYHMTGGWKYADDYIGCRLVCPLSDVVDLMKCDNIVEESEQ